MNNSDFAVFFLKNAVSNAMKEGGSQLIEELAQALNVEQLDFLIKKLTKVQNSKKNVVR